MRIFYTIYLEGICFCVTFASELHNEWFYNIFINQINNKHYGTF